jgi:hypothetical protein
MPRCLISDANIQRNSIHASDSSVFLKRLDVFKKRRDVSSQTSGRYFKETKKTFSLAIPIFCRILANWNIINQLIINLHEENVEIGVYDARYGLHDIVRN